MHLRVPLLLLLLVAGCASPSGTRSGRVDGHLGFDLPLRVGPFVRQRVELYDDPSLGAVASYRLVPPDALLISVYPYPIPKDPQGEALPIGFVAQEELRGILAFHPGSRLIDWPVGLDWPGPAGVTVYRGALEIDREDAGVVISLLELYDYGDVLLKFRISYPVTHEDAPLRLHAFHASYPFP